MGQEFVEREFVWKWLELITVEEEEEEEVEVIALVAVMIEAVGGVMTEDLAEVTMTDLDLPTGHHHAEEADLWRETGGEVEEEEAGLVVQGDSNFPER